MKKNGESKGGTSGSDLRWLKHRGLTTVCVQLLHIDAINTTFLPYARLSVCLSYFPHLNLSRNLNLLSLRVGAEFDDCLHTLRIDFTRGDDWDDWIQCGG